MIKSPKNRLNHYGFSKEIDYPLTNIEVPQSAIVKIFHFVIFVSGRLLLFQRETGIWNFLSGEIKPNESLVLSASREAFEEAELKIRPDKIQITDYRFSGLARTAGP